VLTIARVLRSAFCCPSINSSFPYPEWFPLEELTVEGKAPHSSPVCVKRPGTALPFSPIFYTFSTVFGQRVAPSTYQICDSHADTLKVRVRWSPPPLLNSTEVPLLRLQSGNAPPLSIVAPTKPHLGSHSYLPKLQRTPASPKLVRFFGCHPRAA